MKVVIVVPVYNDWDSFARLTSEIESVLQDQDVDYSILASDDDSSISSTRFEFKGNCRILHLTCNLGHQRAIAIGLAKLADTEMVP